MAHGVISGPVDVARPGGAAHAASVDRIRLIILIAVRVLPDLTRSFGLIGDLRVDPAQRAGSQVGAASRVV